MAPPELPTGSGYVALGSSYAAGPGLGLRPAGSPVAAGRSGRNYAHLLAAALGLDLTDVTFSGATVAQMLGRVPGATARPQLEAVTATTRLVTLTGGGNDVGYIPFLVTASIPRPLLPLVGGRRRLRELSDPAVFDEKLTNLAVDLASLFEAIRGRAPRATIAVAGYLGLLPPDDTVRARPLSDGDAELGRAYAARLESTLRAATEAAGVLFVPTSAASATHHAWSADPWTARFVLAPGRPAPYHPTAAGMRAVADLLAGALDTAP